VLSPLAFGLGAQRNLPSAQEKPNIVLIMADDLGYECLGCYGSTSYQTPNLDGLAATGVRFTRAYATPVCTPSRVQIMTGQYPFRSGWRSGIWELPRDKRVFDPRATNFAHLLKAAGYATAVAGKWQLARFDDHPDHVTQCGFDEHCVWTGEFGTGTPPPYWFPGVWENGKLVEGLMAPDFPSLAYFEGLHSHDAPAKVFGPDYFSDYLIDFINRHAGRPFFAYYPMVLPHLPGVVTPDSKVATALKGYHPALFQAILQLWQTWDGDQLLFVDMVEYMDKLVGRVIGALDALGIRDRTVVIFTADNGTASQITSKLGNIEITGGKGQISDAGTHVPMIVNWRSMAVPGLICDDLVDLSDVLPSLIELAGAKLPDHYVVDGLSLVGRVLGRGGKPRDWVIITLDGKIAVRSSDWILLNDSELFNLRNDPLETRPITAGHDSPESARARKALAGVLATFDLKSS
jgi:arylsulfatase A